MVDQGEHSEQHDSPQEDPHHHTAEFHGEPEELHPQPSDGLTDLKDLLEKNGEDITRVEWDTLEDHLVRLSDSPLGRDITSRDLLDVVRHAVPPHQGAETLRKLHDELGERYPGSVAVAILAQWLYDLQHSVHHEALNIQAEDTPTHSTIAPAHPYEHHEPPRSDEQGGHGSDSQYEHQETSQAFTGTHRASAEESAPETEGKSAIFPELYDIEIHLE